MNSGHNSQPLLPAHNIVHTPQPTCEKQTRTQYQQTKHNLKLRALTMAATRLRKTFHYPDSSDDEDTIEAGLDAQGT